MRAVVFFGAAALDVFAGAALRDDTLLAAFFVVLPLDAVTVLDFVALRAGAFSAAERLIIGLGRAVDLLPNVRFFPEDVDEVWREAGREEDRLTPLTIGSLMRSHQLSKGALNHRAATKTIRSLAQLAP